MSTEATHQPDATMPEKQLVRRKRFSAKIPAYLLENMNLIGSNPDIEKTIAELQGSYPSPHEVWIDKMPDSL